MVVAPAEHGAGAGRRLDQGEIFLLGGGVDDDVEAAGRSLLGRPRDHQVVEDAALLVEEDRVTDLTGLETADVARDQALGDRGNGVVVGVGIAGALRQGQERRPHVGHIEEAGVLTRPFVLGDDTGRVLDRHGVAGERHHAPPELAVESGERRFAQTGTGSVFGQRQVLGDRWRDESHAIRPAPPLSGEPERFPASLIALPDGKVLHTFPGNAICRSSGRKSASHFSWKRDRGYSFGERASPLLSRVSPTVRSFCLRVSGAVAPSAPNRNVRPELSRRSSEPARGLTGTRLLPGRPAL